MSRRISAGVAASLLLCTVLACKTGYGSGDDVHDDNNFREDVIECEDALARLERCCPDFDPTPVLCNFRYDATSGCGSGSVNSVEPAFNVHESACIRDRSCDALVVDKVCERAQAARAYTKASSWSTSRTSSSKPSATTTEVFHKPVCP